MPMVISGLALFVVCISVFALLGTVFWIWMVVDCIMNKKISDMQKAFWVLLIVFTHFIGALIYFFVGRSMQPKQQTYQYYVQPQAPRHHRDEAPREAFYNSYEQGYQASQQPASTQYNDVPSIYPEREQAQRPQASSDYEQPQAMYPHEPHEE
jgi:Phospholipase_D-nuclease N-terminal